MRLALISAFVFGLFAAAHISTAFAWGDDGHRITGLIANEYLNDRTRNQLRQLIGTDDLSTIATWMDDEREQLNERLPGSSRWHYENRSMCSAYNEAQSCAKGQCVTRQIERLEKLLRDPSTSKEQRADSIRMLVHLIGDVHQPLHVADHNDRGGNDVWAQLPKEREPRRLHELWDTRFVRMNVGRRGIARYARTLMDRTSVPEWMDGDVRAWAAESNQLATRLAYGDLPGFACRSRLTTEPIMIPESYIQAARSAVEVQLTKAGLRIAATLNATVGR